MWGWSTSKQCKKHRAPGFQDAVEFDVSYWVQGVPYRGVAKVSLAPSYDTTTMAVTAAISVADQWSDYSSWLPQVADQIAATNGAAFGMRGLMQQNLRNSVAYGEAARQYRTWSQENWRQVTNEREQSQDRGLRIHAIRSAPARESGAAEWRGFRVPERPRPFVLPQGGCRPCCW